MHLFRKTLVPIFLGAVLAGGFATVAIVPPSAQAQAGLGTLVGTVADSSHAVVPGATVTLTNEGTGLSQTTTSNSAGIYRFQALTVTSGYSLNVSASGFKTAEVKGITTSVGTSITVDVTLEIGSNSQTVEVSAAINEEQVQTDTSAVSQLIDATVWNESPLAVRSSNDFVGLTAGAAPDSGGTGRGFSINGARTGTGNFLLEGFDNNDQGLGGGGAAMSAGSVTTISPDAIQEYRVIASVPEAEYGRAGGFATDTVLKSGTKQWHGSLFEY
ncbi:MAG TPA: carboxypeptidase-like regulatory domain-containing protein, partial [Acidobacteriaceae bacterium]|nr:carboxypeptidase-like regulatory domain-containing protein [Acidobacteriaceae bacterium]